MAKATAPKLSILEAFANVTEEDLAAINVEIEDRKSQIAKLEGEIAALRVMHRTIDVKLHGKPERKKPVRKTKPDGAAKGSGSSDADEADRSKIYDWLVKHGQPAKPGTISAATGVHHIRVASLCRHEWFEESIAGFSIA